MQEIKNIIESLLFVAEEPLTVEKLRTILETADSKEIQANLKALAEEYDQRGGGFMLREVAGGWQIRSRPEFNEWIKRMLQPSPQRLSRAALETLAVIAYKQPIIRADIEHIRGVDCGGVLRQLMERKIIRVLGRKEIAGRPLIYATTKLFLEMFDLKDLNDLPTPKEIAELGNAMIDSQQAAPAPDATAAAESPAAEGEDDLEGTVSEEEAPEQAQQVESGQEPEMDPEAETELAHPADEGLPREPDARSALDEQNAAGTDHAAYPDEQEDETVQWADSDQSADLPTDEHSSPELDASSEPAAERQEGDDDDIQDNDVSDELDLPEDIGESDAEEPKNS